jgi:hypothetical protein
MGPVDLSSRFSRGCLALLVLFAAVPKTSAAQDPTAPAQQHSTSGSISGFISDRDGDSITGACITLTRDTQPPDASPRTIVTASDGGFTFQNLPPGAFNLSITAAGFSPQQTSVEIHAAEDLELPTISLAAASTTNIQVSASPTEIAEAQVHMEEQQRVLGIFPNFYVSYISDPAAMTPRQKYQMAFRTMVDPVSFILNGVTAATEQADNIYDWGQGAQGYAKRYAAAYGTFLTGTLLGNATLPVLFKQDPRYFVKGTGSVRSRVLYAIANSVICKGDNHHWQPDYSGILGGLAATGISNAYYPTSNHTGARLIFEGTALGIGTDAIQNIIQEFLVRRLTPHIPLSTPTQ